ncbi:MAG: hypothetical protein GY906_11535 [bacterium]|nr:hypothetical protein [bacterium]
MRYEGSAELVPIINSCEREFRVEQRMSQSESKHAWICVFRTAVRWVYAKTRQDAITEAIKLGIGHPIQIPSRDREGKLRLRFAVRKAGYSASEHRAQAVRRRFASSSFESPVSSEFWDVDANLKKYFRIRQAGHPLCLDLAASAGGTAGGEPEWLLHLCEIGGKIARLDRRQREAIVARWEAWCEFEELQRVADIKGTPSAIRRADQARKKMKDLEDPQKHPAYLEGMKELTVLLRGFRNIPGDLDTESDLSLS